MPWGGNTDKTDRDPTSIHSISRERFVGESGTVLSAEDTLTG